MNFVSRCTVSRPLSWAERPADGLRRESRSSAKDSKEDSKTKVVGGARSLLRRSLSFGAKDRDRRESAAATSSGNLAPGVAGRRGRSVESLRTMPPRFESYSSPTKSFTQKMVHATSIGEYLSISHCAVSFKCLGERIK